MKEMKAYTLPKSPVMASLLRRGILIPQGVQDASTGQNTTDDDTDANDNEGGE